MECIEFINGVWKPINCDLSWWQFFGSTSFRNVALLVGALIGIGLAVWRSRIADRQVKTSEAGLNIDRFQKGVAMLGDERLSVRQAGILMLSELSQQNMAEYFEPVMKILCSFVRDRSREQRGHFTETTGEKIKDIKADLKRRGVSTKTASRAFGSSDDDRQLLKQLERLQLAELQDEILDDCQTTIESISNINTLYWRNPGSLHENPISFIDLNRTHLVYSNMDNLFLKGANLVGANLSRSFLETTNLDQCNFYGSNFKDAHVTRKTFGISTKGNISSEVTHLVTRGFLKHGQLEKAKIDDPDFLEELRLADEAQKAAEEETDQP